MTDQSGTTTYSYDAHGRLLTKTQKTVFSALNFTQSLSYQYDAAGRIQQVTYPSGTQITTTYGTDSRPSELRINGNALISNITYHPFGEPKSWTWGNGQTYTRSFDTDGRLKTHPMGNDTRTITFDAANRITQTIDTNPLYNRNFDYDVNNRLTNQSDNTSFKIWSYDANSNRTQYDTGSATYAYTIAANSNRLQTAQGAVAKSYTYDAAGNPLTDGQTTFTWDAGGKLATTLRGGKTHTYKYNALEQRISKNGPLSVRNFFFYDENSQLIGEYKDNISTKTPINDWLVLQETVWLDDIPVAVIKKPTATSPIQVHYIHTDHLNTPRVIVNSSNTTIWSWDNVHAFGANLPFEDPDNNGQTFEYNPRFPGQYFDKETNLHYNYFRYYEPETGRYISPDPIGLMGGMNTYGYVEQNPLSFIDPTGEAIPAIIAACAGNPACAAAIGALSGAGIDLASQLFGNGGNLQCVDKSSIATSAGIGALPLGIAGAAGSKFLARNVTQKEITVIGRIKDLQKLKRNEKSLLSRLPYQGDPKADWKQNSSILRQEMAKRQPIRDVSPRDKDGIFLNAERNLLKSKKWEFDEGTNFWNPPVK